MSQFLEAGWLIGLVYGLFGVRWLVRWCMCINGLGSRPPLLGIG